MHQKAFHVYKVQPKAFVLSAGNKGLLHAIPTCAERQMIIFLKGKKKEKILKYNFSHKQNTLKLRNISSMSENA